MIRLADGTTAKAEPATFEYMTQSYASIATTVENHRTALIRLCNEWAGRFAYGRMVVKHRSINANSHQVQKN